MRAARIHDFLDVRIEELPRPKPGPGEAIVRTLACGICSGDVTPWYIRKKAPLVFGHEPAGQIVEVGRDVTDFQPGDRVFVHHHAPCLACDLCRRGEHVQCETWRNTNLRPGGMAEFFLVPAPNLRHDTLLLPDHVSAVDGSLVEPLACVVKSLGRAGQVRDATVLVIGLGVMGQLHVRLARHLGARRVIGADFFPVRCEHAQRLGADHTLAAGEVDVEKGVLDVTDGEGADIVIAGPATPEAIELGLRCARRGGTVIQFMGTPPGTHVTLPAHDFYFRELRLIPSYSCGPQDTRAALDLIAGGVVTAATVVTHRFPFEDVGEAYRIAAEDRSAIKTVVCFEDDDLGTK